MERCGLICVRTRRSGRLLPAQYIIYR
jgi:hypothetical protein